jgi:UDP-glucose 4-epimerase
MPEQKVILVTGVSGYWGGCVAAQLATQPGCHVIGLDSTIPKGAIDGLDFIQTDLHNPLLDGLLKTAKVDTVCHLAFMECQAPTKTAFENNVMGTLKLFAACALAGVRKIVLKSSTMVYGAFPGNSFYLPEEHPLKGSRTYGYTRDLIEIEAFCNVFRRQSPQVQLTILRFAHIIGPTADTPMTRFLKEPLTPVLWGFNPMMQVIHESDAVGALVHVVNQDVPGVFNVAAVDHMPLERLMAIAGKIPLPVFHLFAYWGSDLRSRLGLQVSRSTPIELDYIRYGYLGDLNRMRTEMFFSPHYTAKEALREFAGHRRILPYLPENKDWINNENGFTRTIGKRRSAQQATPYSGNEDNQVDVTQTDSLDTAQAEGVYHE